MRWGFIQLCFLSLVSASPEENGVNFPSSLHIARKYEILSSMTIQEGLDFDA